ncbi:unnamed protein product [Fraxinus pennsylvanica]|uniref:Uncharacterized protein n=1 Tax=Fraxinus pennsylvanica TaxID=56036 RepID=A0AAD2DLB4_9LAMI|nr:unnamed protein product [Fraxinus pennsylvanica]
MMKSAADFNKNLKRITMKRELQMTFKKVPENMMKDKPGELKNQQQNLGNEYIRWFGEVGITFFLGSGKQRRAADNETTQFQKGSTRDQRTWGCSGGFAIREMDNLVAFLGGTRNEFQLIGGKEVGT